MKKITNNEKENKSELTGLTRQIRLTCQIWDPCHKSVITKYKKININELNQTKKK